MEIVSNSRKEGQSTFLSSKCVYGEFFLLNINENLENYCSIDKYDFKKQQQLSMFIYNVKKW